MTDQTLVPIERSPQITRLTNPLTFLWALLFRSEYFQAQSPDQWPDDLRRTGAWLAAGLLAWPLLIPTLALTFGVLPYPLPDVRLHGLLLACSLLIIPLLYWVLHRTTQKNRPLPGSIAALATGTIVATLVLFVAVVVALGLANPLAYGLAVTAIYIVAGGVAVSMVDVTTRVVTKAVVLSIVAGVVFGMTIVVLDALARDWPIGLTGFAGASLAVLAVFGVAWSIETGIQRGRASVGAILGGIVWLAGSAILIGLCWLGGYAMLG